MSKRDRATFEERDLESLLESGDHSDFTILCKDSSWKVHKDILCLRSKFFATLFKNDCVETREGKVDLTGDDPVAVGRMLGYLYIHAIEYGQDFDEKDQDSVTKRMLEILALYVLGDKYDMPGLRKWCRTAFEKLEDKAQESCLLKLVAEAVASIPHNDQELLDDIIRFCATNIDLIYKHVPDSNIYHTSPEWNNIFHDHPVFTTRLLQEVTTQSLNQAKADQDRISSLKEENNTESQSLTKRISDLEHEIEASRNTVYVRSIGRECGSARPIARWRPDHTSPGSGTI